jgi:hypothetical protein
VPEATRRAFTPPRVKCAPMPWQSRISGNNKKSGNNNKIRIKESFNAQSHFGSFGIDVARRRRVRGSGEGT